MVNNRNAIFRISRRPDLAEVKDFFFSHYAPNNAILCLAGNITAEKT